MKINRNATSNQERIHYNLSAMIVKYEKMLY